MQAILIMLPILVYAFLTGVLLAYILFVVLPRMRRRADKKRTSGTTPP
jgi:lipopolysaccharide export LptBFGC system permease protein LptF